MKTFVPLNDILLYEHPERLPAQLVPYRVGLPCVHGQAGQPSAAQTKADPDTRTRQVRHEH